MVGDDLVDKGGLPDLTRPRDDLDEPPRLRQARSEDLRGGAPVCGERRIAQHTE
jgi:hypothetical protein